jgi:glycosyltransferase involved in cell wall biosynthesis
LKISVITVTYNQASVLNDCIKSVEAQSHDAVEHIVIDGASTDDTLTLLKAKKNKIAVLVSEPDNGIYYAMNKGIKLSKGDIVGFLNSDDYYVNNEVLAKVARIFKNDPLLDACYADLIYVDKVNTYQTIRYFKSGKFIPGSFSKGWCPPHPTFFVRRSIFERFGSFDLSYRIAADVDLMMRFLEVYKIKSFHIPEIWVKMRTGGTTNKNLKNIWLQNQEIISAFSKNGLPVNKMIFFICKIISRGKQFFKK